MRSCPSSSRTTTNASAARRRTATTRTGRCGGMRIYPACSPGSYLVEPGPDTLPFAGKRVRVYEWEDGRVEIRCEDRLLPFSPFDKGRCVNQGAIVENKRLSAVLSVIHASQLERDRARLASKKLTLREKERTKGALVKAGAVGPVLSPNGPSEVASFLARFAAEQKARRKVHNDRAALRRKSFG